MVESPDPRVVESIAVTAEDVVMALEATERAGERTVLRLTPPFSGRMRARIHVPGTEEAHGDADGPTPVHVDPASLVADPPPYPHPDDTADELRREAGVEYTPERHHDRHVAAVEAWREAVRGSIVDSVDLPVGDGGHRVDVAMLG